MKPFKSAIAVAVLSAIALTGCSSSDSGDTAGAAIECTPADGPVTLSFTSWIPGIEDVVDVWNKANPEIQVKVQTGRLAGDQIEIVSSLSVDARLVASGAGFLNEGDLVRVANDTAESKPKQAPAPVPQSQAASK